MRLTQGDLTASAAWNLDFWGRYRRATESARATLLANEWAQKEVIATLVANLAADYFHASAVGSGIGDFAANLRYRASNRWS